MFRPIPFCNVLSPLPIFPKKMEEDMARYLRSNGRSSKKEKFLADFERLISCTFRFGHIFDPSGSTLARLLLIKKPELVVRMITSCYNEPRTELADHSFLELCFDVECSVDVFSEIIKVYETVVEEGVWFCYGELLPDYAIQFGDLEYVKMFVERGNITESSLFYVNRVLNLVRMGLEAPEKEEPVLESFHEILKHPMIHVAAARDERGRTLLSDALRKNLPDIAEIYLEKDVDNFMTRSCDECGVTPLHIFAIKANHGIRSVDWDTSFFSSLLSHGADVNAVDVDGETALFFSMVSGNNEVARRLVQQGASPAKSNNEGVTPLMMASDKGNLEAVRLFLEAGAPKDQTDLIGNTAKDYLLGRPPDSPFFDELLKEFVEVLECGVCYDKANLAKCNFCGKTYCVPCYIMVTKTQEGNCAFCKNDLDRTPKRRKIE